MAESGVDLLKKAIGTRPRLVTLLGGAKLPAGIKPTSQIVYKRAATFKPTPQDDLRADLIVLDPKIGASSDLAERIHLGSHDHGFVYALASLAAWTPYLKAVGFRTVGSSHQLWEKTHADAPAEYDESYLARWGDNDFMANAKNAALQIIDKFPPGSSLKKSRVVDVGCLNGYIMESLYREGVTTLFGTDISYPIAVTHAINPYHLPAIRVFDFVENTYADESFDVTICMEVLEHIPPEITEGFVSELARITTSGGRLLLSASEDWDSDPTHINCRNRAEWYQIFARHGLVAVGEQLIFPGFNNFVMRKAKNPLEKLALQAYYGLKVAIGGKIAPPAGKQTR